MSSGVHDPQHSSPEFMGKNQDVFQIAFDHSSMGRTLSHVDGRLLRVNTAMAKLLGYTQDELMQYSFDKLTHPEDLEASDEVVRCLKAGEQESYQLEKRYLHRNGSVIWALVSTTLTHDSDGQPLYFITDILDITAQKQAENALLHSNRAHRALSRCNEALFRADHEAELFQQICNIVVKEAGYKMCWVGEAEQNETSSVRVVSQSGFAHDELNTVNITWADTERGQGPIGTCIRTRQPVLAKEITLDPTMVVWRETAFKYALTSCLAIPLITDDLVFGALSIYANESGAFNDEEVELLIELANNLSFGLLTLRTRKEHAKAKDALQETQKLLNESQRIAKVGGWEFNVSAGKVLWTDEVYRIHGLPLDYNTSHPEEAIQFYAPEDQKRINAAFQRALEQGEAYDLELKLNTAQGQTIWVRTDGHAELKNGKVHRVFGNIMDITERKHAEEKLEDSLNLLRYVLENIPVRVFWKDRELKYLGCNTTFARDAGMESPEDLLGKDDFQMGWHAQAEMYRADDKVLMDTQRPRIGIEEPQTTPDGKTIWLRTSKVPLYKKNSPEVIGVLGVYEDITEYKQTETERQRLRQELNHAQKMEAIGRLAGGVAHDFNNMLSVIQGYAELALMQVKSDEKLFRPLNEIHDAAVRSAALTRQLLAFARKQPSTPQVIDLNETITAMLRMLGRLIGEDIQLVWKPSSELWQVMLDPSQVDQMLANLIVNARDAIEGVGKVIIETANVSFDENDYRLHGAAPGNYVQLAVSDNGCGMSEEITTRIFEPFFTTKEKGAGTGLGLSTVYGIVKQNKGQIYVYSEPDLGSTFKIYLPVAPIPAAQKIATTTMTSTGGNETILLVDDEPGTLDMAKEVLVTYGYQVIAAADPVEALAAATEYPQPIHLLLTDVIMPAMNDKTLSQQLTAQRPELKTLYMSGYTHNVITANNAQPEPVAFLPKPFSVQSLADKVRQVLDTQ